MCAKSLQSCPTLCDAMNHSLPGSSVYGIFQAGTVEWVAMPSSRGSSNAGVKPTSLKSPALQVDSLPAEPQGKPCWLLAAAATAAKLLQSCLTLCDPRDGSPPGSAIPGILQARTLEWVAISFSSAGK